LPLDPGELLGSHALDFGDCFVMAARREALGRGHRRRQSSLVLRHVMLKTKGMAELLPACNT